MAGLVLGHGAGGGIESPDLLGAAEGAHSAGLSVALVEQPYRVAGRRSPAPAGQLDAAWTTVILALREGPFSDLPILTGGRSSGARVACRTAAETDSVAVLCLAFPLHPPGHPEKSRLAELDAVCVPTLVVQGENDPFGTPPSEREPHRYPHPWHPLAEKQHDCCVRRIGLACDNGRNSARALTPAEAA